jgi:pyroglutamyl-peptidase I
VSETILITGFEPFGGIQGNPTMDIVAALHGSRLDNRQIVGRILPVAYDGHALRLKSLMDEVEPVLVIGFGLDTEANGIKLETVAFNEADFDIPDNDGAVVRKTRLDPLAPASRLATYVADDISAALSAARIRTYISANAGRYLCNATLFHLLGLCATKPQRPLCGFVHVPFSVEQLAASPVGGATTSALSLDTMIDAARLILRLCSQTIQHPMVNPPPLRLRAPLEPAFGYGR